MKKYISRSYWAEQDIELTLGNMLRFGVVLSAVVTAIGGCVYLLTSGAARQPGFREFVGETPTNIRFKDILLGVAQLRGQSIMQLGILLLIATPVVRILFSFFAFLLEKDYMYVVLTFIVLCIIAVSLLGGFA